MSTSTHLVLNCAAVPHEAIFRAIPDLVPPDITDVVFPEGAVPSYVELQQLMEGEATVKAWGRAAYSKCTVILPWGTSWFKAMAVVSQRVVPSQPRTLMVRVGDFLFTCSDGTDTFHIPPEWLETPTAAMDLAALTLPRHLELTSPTWYLFDLLGMGAHDWAQQLLGQSNVTQLSLPLSQFGDSEFASQLFAEAEPGGLQLAVAASWSPEVAAPLAEFLTQAWKVYCLDESSLLLAHRGSWLYRFQFTIEISG